MPAVMYKTITQTDIQSSKEYCHLINYLFWEFVPWNLICWDVLQYFQVVFFSIQRNDHRSFLELADFEWNEPLL